MRDDHNVNTPLVLVLIPEGCRTNRLSCGTVPPHHDSFSQLAVIALICISFLNGVSDTSDCIWIVMTMKCEHRVVSYSAQLCLSNMHIIVCGESRWAWIYFGT